MQPSLVGPMSAYNSTTMPVRVVMSLLATRYSEVLDSGLYLGHLQHHMHSHFEPVLVWYQKYACGTSLGCAGRPSLLSHSAMAASNA